MKKLKEGISVIIPYSDKKNIIKTLDSLINQTFDFNLFEVILINYGAKTPIQNIIKKYEKENPGINIISAGSENGIETASRKYCFFIYADDYISHNYLEKLYENSKEDRIVVGTLYDENESGEIENSPLNPSFTGIVVNNIDTIEILTLPADKIIPTRYIKKYQFNPCLDTDSISFFSKLYTENELEFYIMNTDENANYYRLCKNSDSESYEFNIIGRLKVIKDIDGTIKESDSQDSVNYMKTFANKQVMLMNLYIANHPDEYSKILKDINSFNFEFFPYKYLNEDISKLDNEKRELLISYAFSPTNTTTSNVVAKRILSEKKNVDVICGQLNSQPKDYIMEDIIEDYIINKYVVDTDFSIEWSNVKEFTDKGMEILGNTEIYDKIYSRAFFSHSHFLALEYKLAHPETYWRAEFSDPLVKPLGRRTSREIYDKQYVKKMNDLLKAKGLELISVEDDVNLICEYLTYIYADEIIFTNINQKKAMIDKSKYDIGNIISGKSRISPHPTLEEKYYTIVNSNYEIDESYLNFAYFGDIFSKRSFEDFISAFENIEDNLKIRIHVFSKNKTLFEQVLSKKIFNKVILNEEVNYLEFLNLTKKFDVLLVEDSYTFGEYEVNPFLPSKLSDYIGSGNSIWGVCEENSPMDKMNIEYKSRLGDYLSNVTVINQIIKDKMDVDCEKKVIDESIHSRRRINLLTEKITELISVCETEFGKDAEYEAEIAKLNYRIAELENEYSEITNSNSWKLTENFRKLGKKFK